MLDINMLCRIVIPASFAYYGMSCGGILWFAISGLPAVLSMHVSFVSGSLHCATA